MIRLFIADDHPIVREGLKRLVAETPDLRLVGEATHRDEILQNCRRSEVDLLIMDIAMPGLGFLETMRFLRKTQPDLPILVLSMHSEDLYAVRVLKAGAFGYLCKDHSSEVLLDAIRTIHRGRKFVTPSLAEKLVGYLEPDAETLPHERLSDREYQVLIRVAAGKLIKEIAAELKVSPKTVSTYRSRILEKMALETNAELVRYVLEKGLADN